MAKQAVAAHAVDLEPIDRLEEKITRLVTMVVELRAAQARAQDENARLTQEIESLRARLADADATARSCWRCATNVKSSARVCPRCSSSSKPSDGAKAEPRLRRHRPARPAEEAVRTAA
jgi:uncharacterized paraquat-inducible protein A